MVEKKWFGHARLLECYNYTLIEVLLHLHTFVSANVPASEVAWHSQTRREVQEFGVAEMKLTCLRN